MFELSCVHEYTYITLKRISLLFGYSFDDVGCLVHCLFKMILFMNNTTTTSQRLVVTFHSGH